MEWWAPSARPEVSARLRAGFGGPTSFRQGRAWRRLHVRNCKITSDEGLVDLEHVLSSLGQDAFS